MGTISNARAWAKILAAGGAGVGLAAALVVAAPVRRRRSRTRRRRSRWPAATRSSPPRRRRTACGTTGTSSAPAPWRAQPVAGSGTTYSAPTITGNQGYGNIAVEGPGHTLSFYWQKNGDLVWNLQVIPGATDYQAPAIIAATFEEDDEACILEGLEVFCASNGGGSWSPLGVNSNAGYDGSDSAITVNNESMNIAIFGVAGELDFFWQDDHKEFHRDEVAPASHF